MHPQLRSTPASTPGFLAVVSLGLPPFFVLGFAAALLTVSAADDGEVYVGSGTFAIRGNTGLENYRFLMHFRDATNGQFYWIFVRRKGGGFLIL
jgi:hypothetical protein